MAKKEDAAFGHWVDSARSLPRICGGYLSCATGRCFGCGLLSVFHLLQPDPAWYLCLCGPYLLVSGRAIFLLFGIYIRAVAAAAPLDVLRLHAHY